VIAAAQGGALGSLPCAMISRRRRASRSTSSASASQRRSICILLHKPVAADWCAKPDGRHGLRLLQGVGARSRGACHARQPRAVDEAMCALVEESKPEVVSSISVCQIRRW